MKLKAYKVGDQLVFAFKGTEAKLLAAPLLRTDEEWQKDVSGWVALRAERMPELDHQVDLTRTEPYFAS